MPSYSHGLCVAGLLLLSVTAVQGAAEPRIAAERCNELRLEQIKYQQSGVVDDMKKGPEWAKTNLPKSRLDEIQSYIDLEEQLKFGCRDADLLVDAKTILEPDPASGAEDGAKPSKNKKAAKSDVTAKASDAPAAPAAKKPKRSQPTGAKAPAEAATGDLIWPGLAP